MAGFDSRDVITIFILLFSIVDPFGCVPLFLAMTPRDSAAARNRMALRACIVAFLVLGIFTFVGRLILDFFSVTIPAFQIAGGIIIFLTALPMLSARRVTMKSQKPEELEGAEKEDISIVPLAIPILAGPGAITTVVILSDRHPFFSGKLLILGCAALVCLIVYIVLTQAQRLAKLIGQTGLHILTRIMGLILLVLAVQFALNGIESFLSPP
jgi:multiple antibiotic resistance protein